MMVKTSELTGAALDWAVARVIAFEETQLSALRIKQGRPFLLVDGGNPYGPARACHSSTDWAQGGPIIEREGIGLAAKYNISKSEVRRRKTDGTLHELKNPT